MRVLAKRFATVFAIWNSKGGVGKTTTTINLAYNFMLLGKRVLIIDNDPQTNTTPVFRKANEQGYTIRDLYKNPAKIKRYICRTKYKGIDIIKGSTYLTEEYANKSDLLLYEALQVIKEDYDIVLIDCRPSYEGLTRNAISAADVLLTPILLDGYCRDNLNLVERVYKEIADEESGMDIKWCVFANKIKNLNAEKTIHRDLSERHDYPIISTCISNRAAVISATTLRKPLVKHRKSDTATQEFLELADELLEV